MGRWRSLCLAGLFAAAALLAAPDGASPRPGSWCDTRSPAWSPDGSLIAFSPGHGSAGFASPSPSDLGLRAVHPDGSDLETLTMAQPNPPGAFYVGDSDPVWSPDGGSLAFVSSFGWLSGWPNGGGWSTVNVLDLATMSVRQLGVGTEPAWSSDGRLAWTRSDGGFVLNGRVFAGKRARPSWSPQGGQVVYEQRIRGRTGIVVMRSSGGSSRRIGWGEAPSWSPDGRWIAFIRDDVAGVEIVSSDGRRVLRARLPVGDPSWSPDSSYLALGTKIYSLRSGHVRTIPIPDGARSTKPSWSPDSHWLVFGQYAYPFLLVRVDGTDEHDVNPCP
jgi:Tol biopolymer transport system component